MALTLGLTGMDPATEVALKAAVAEANARLGRDWQLVPEAEADHIMVDMDSMYGPMSWLRLHAAGKSVIGLTTAERTQADLHLARPFTPATVAEVLDQAATAEARAPARKTGARVPAAGAKAPAPKPALEATAVEPELVEIVETAVFAESVMPAPLEAAATEQKALVAASDVADTEPEPMLEVARSDVTAPAPPALTPKAPTPAPPPKPQPQVQLQAPAIRPQPVAKQTPAKPASPAATIPQAPGSAASQPRSAMVTDPAMPALLQRTLADWLVLGALRGRVRYQPGKGELLLIDADRRQYHGPSTLKPLTSYFQGTLGRDEFVPLDDSRWASESKAMTAPQPLTRLQWFGGLLAGDGKLLPGFDPEGRYKLTKWPETEREFPHHFRLATTMMKGPATLEEIARASGVAIDKVADYVNASLANGFAEYLPKSSTEPAASTKPGSLFGRLRGK